MTKRSNYILLSRRAFLKISGAATVVAAIPVFPLNDPVPPYSELAVFRNTVPITITNLPKGAFINILSQATNELIYHGVAEGPTVEARLETEHEMDVIITIRSPKLQSVWIPIHTTPDGTKISVNTIQIADEIA